MVINIVNMVKNKKEVNYMNEFKDNIKKELEILKNMITLNKDKSDIEKQKQKLNQLLEEYLKDF